MSRYALIGVGAGCLLLALVAGCAWLVIGNPVSLSAWDRIQVGTTSEEVRALLGEPDATYSRNWVYQPALNAGWVQFTFDEDERLISKNDESVFGSLWKRSRVDRRER